jgi:hypothetical protein
MQSNTTGHSMEVFFTVLLVASLIGNFFLSKSIREIRAAQKISDSKQEDLKIYLTNIFDIVRSIPLPSQLPQSPIKPNNWDSVREAFKGPVRVDLNERT